MLGNHTGDGYCNRVTVYIIIITVPALAFAWIETYTFASYFSAFGIFSFFCSLTLIFGYMAKITQKGGVSPEEMKAFDFHQFIGNVGIAAFTFEVNGVIVNIKAETKNQNRFPYILILAVVTIWFLCIAYALFAYYVFKSDL